ncbi:hypothetical protein AAC387_Pa10g0276 [Persea americana]
MTISTITSAMEVDSGNGTRHNHGYHDAVMPHESGVGDTLHENVKSDIRFQMDPSKSRDEPIVSFTASELESARKKHVINLIVQCQGSRILTQLFLS